jgi:hypothetical protein
MPCRRAQSVIPLFDSVNQAGELNAQALPLQLKPLGTVRAGRFKRQHGSNRAGA